MGWSKRDWGQRLELRLGLGFKVRVIVTTRNRVVGKVCFGVRV